METVYYYIADNNSDKAVQLLTSKYNFSVANNYTVDDIASGLQEIVNTDGALALQDVMNLHPDKMVILELFSNDGSNSGNTMTTTNPMPAVPSLPSYQNQDKDDSMDGKKHFLNNPTNVMIAAAVLIGTIALLKSK